MTTTIDNSTIDNGVNVEALLGARAAITETPELGQVHLAA